MSAASKDEPCWDYELLPKPSFTLQGVNPTHPPRPTRTPRSFANAQDRQPEYPCEYRHDQARTFINAVKQRGINVLFAS